MSLNQYTRTIAAGKTFLSPTDLYISIDVTLGVATMVLPKISTVFDNTSVNNIYSYIGIRFFDLINNASVNNIIVEAADGDFVNGQSKITLNTNGVGGLVTPVGSNNWSLTINSISSGGGGGSIGGGGTLNYISKFNPDGTNIANSLLYDNGISVGLGTVNPDASAILELSSTTKGFAPPRMTTLERDAILNPVISLLIFNLTTSLYNYWNGLNWIQIYQSSQIGASVNGLGSAIQVGSVGFSIPAFSGNITSWSLVGDVSGSVVFDILVGGVSIVGAGNKPTITASTDNAENVLGWTSVAVVEGTYVEFIIESVSSFTNINLVLNIS
jgi:hypothetical protein